MTRIALYLLLPGLFAACQPESGPTEPTADNWRSYRGDPASSQYSALDLINRENVRDLEVAWTYRTGGAGQRSAIQCNPLVIDGRLYGTSPDLRLFALDAATGRELWTFDPAYNNDKHGGVNRGLAYWKDGADERILLTSANYLLALDAQNGTLITSFGDSGRVDLRLNMDMEPEKVSLTVTSPGVVYGDKIILGSSVGEGYQSSPGHVRAYNVHTGAWEWTFHTIPLEGEMGYDTWQWQTGVQYGGANAWGGLSLDEQRGWVFLATGSAAFDFYGGDRLGQNLFANCVIALNADTGERIWHYQTVHHDLWDYDLPCAPNLLSIQWEGQPRDVVVQPTKMGHLFVLDRETGEPVFPVEERPVPLSAITGEVAWPTQPIPQLPEPFTRQGMTADLLSDISPQSRAFVQEKFAEMQGGGLYTPPSLQGTVAMPGTRGGAEWSGAAVDPQRGILYINANEIPNILQLKPEIPEAMAMNMAPGKKLYQANCSMCHGLEKQGAPPVYPSLKGVTDRYPAAEVQHIIRNGKGSMPGHAHFSAAELEELVAFLAKEEEPVTAADVAVSSAGIRRYLINGYRQFLDQDGYPGIQPPWGTLNAIDLNTGKRLWQQVLGEYPALRDKGVAPTGTQNLGGVIATAGGLLFIGATMDEKFRAFDAESGEVLWETQLPAGGYATPSTYNIAGKQYVVIAAGGGGKCGTPAADYYVAFALRD